jgi:hypothetical protein
MRQVCSMTIASCALALALGPGAARAGSMMAPSTGRVPGDWDIDTSEIGSVPHAPGLTPGDEFFHVAWTTHTDAQGQSRLSGYVYDDEGQPATNVELTIHMLDAGGRELERVNRRVQGTVPGEGRAYFDVPVPTSPSYRVDIGGFDLVEFGFGK